MGFHAHGFPLRYCLVSLISSIYFYAPPKLTRIRIAIVLAVVIYGMAAKAIWDKREHLDGFLNPLNENPFVNTITTQVEITTEERPIVGKEEPNIGIRNIEPSTDRGVGNQYSVDIQVDERAQAARPMPAALRMRSLTREVAKNETNAEAWLYARVAFLFFIALLITWVSCLSSKKKKNLRINTDKSSGPVKCQPSLRPRQPANRQLWHELRRLLRVSLASLLEHNRVHHHLSIRLPRARASPHIPQNPPGSRLTLAKPAIPITAPSHHPCAKGSHGQTQTAALNGRREF